jgi:arabinofuranosyltransferase
MIPKSRSSARIGRKPPKFHASATRIDSCSRCDAVSAIQRVLLLAFAFLVCASCRSRAETGNLLTGRAPALSTRTERPERVTDGVSAPLGSDWDSALASVIGTGGGLEWDLGAPTQIHSAWLEADANDEYALLISDDGRAWQTLWEAPRVDGASGQQVRTTEALSAVARHLRLEPRGGDGAFSVAELGVFGPGALPPQFRQGKVEAEAVVQVRELHVALGIAALFALLSLAIWVFVPGRLPSRLPSRSPAARDLLRDPRSWIVFGAFALVVATSARYRWLYHGNTIDDAYISFQYAKNWASGQGVVFNPGERVEGYTNFLWVALLAPLWPLVGHDAWRFAAAAWILALTLGLLGILAVSVVAARVFRHRLPWVLAVLWLAFDDAFISYTVFALENQLLIVCLLAGLVALTSRFRHWEWVLGLSFALTAMTRPDGVLWPATFVLAALPTLVRDRSYGGRAFARSLGKVLASFVIPFGVYFIWRSTYYGYLFPNTFYLKVGHSLAAVGRGKDYVVSYFRERWWVPFLAVSAFALVRTLWVRWLLLYVVVHTAYVVYVGGDFYSGHRFLMGLTPMFGLLVAASADAWLAPAPDSKWRPLVVGAVAFSATVAIRAGTLTFGPGVLEIQVWNREVDLQVRTMRWLHDRVRPGASIALGDIGGAGFFADLKVLDVYGVVDPHVAHKEVPNFGTGKPGHEKVATAGEIMARAPTYIKWGFISLPGTPPGYFIFNDFPPSIAMEGMFVRDDLEQGHALTDGVVHFAPGELAGWTREGDAFADAPTMRPVSNQGAITGASGPLADSFTEKAGDEARGRLLSPPFTLRGDRMRLLVGGGRDPLHLRVSLLVDGGQRFSETGTNYETLGRREWNIAPLRGKTARIEIVDSSTAPWGHILVDEIEQWVGTSRLPGKL